MGHMLQTIGHLSNSWGSDSISTFPLKRYAMPSKKSFSFYFSNVFDNMKLYTFNTAYDANLPVNLIGTQKIKKKKKIKK